MKWKWIGSVHARDFAIFEIREDLTGRLVADLPAEPLDFPNAVERTRNEARLIAAAPELLEALENLVANTCGNCVECEPPECCNDCANLILARAAISKARGES